MGPEKFKMQAIGIACAFALLLLSGHVPAQQTEGGRNESLQSGKAEANAMQHINGAAAIVKRMENEPGMSKLLQQAKGIFIVPEYGRAALGVGGSGGAGVLLARNNGTWGEPAFYNIGSVSVRGGAQAGAEGGAIAMVLINDKAVNRFRQENNFSLSADAGLTVVDWSKVAQGQAGAGDVVVWSDTMGLFGNAATGVQDIRFNQDQTSAYYKRDVAVNDVINGNVQNPHADVLKQAVATSTSNTATGSSGAASGGASGAASGGASGNGQSGEQSGGSPAGSDSSK